MKDRKLKGSKLSGFTLLEVLIAASLMALMGLLLLNTLNGSIKVKENVDEISTRYQVVRQALSRMAREISMAYLSRQKNTFEPTYATRFKGTKDKISFTAFGNIMRQKDAKESDQRVLSYFVDKDDKGVPSLMRRIHPNLTMDVEKGGKTQVLCPHVKRVEFAYLDDEKWDSQWDSEVEPTTERLPSFVRITLVADMENGEEMKWMTETMIWLDKPIDLK